MKTLTPRHFLREEITVCVPSLKRQMRLWDGGDDE